MTLLTPVLLVLYGTFFLICAGAVLAAPVYLLVAGGRAATGMARRVRHGRRVGPRERARAEAVLREQYASGMLTLVGLEDRVGEVLQARRGVELEHVLDDLPRERRRQDRLAIGCVAVAVALALAGSLPAHVAAVLAAVAAFLPRRTWVVTLLAFATGGLLVGGAALAALVLAGVAGAVGYAAYHDGA